MEHVRSADLITLRPGAWLNDAVIDAFLDHVNRTVGADAGVFCAPTFVQTLARRPPRATPSRKREWPQEVDTSPVVIFPMNENSMHWWLLYVDTQIRRAVIYDSYYDQNDDNVRAARTVLSRIYPHIAFLIYDTSAYLPECPRQPNMHDCGAYVCVAAEALVKGHAPTTAVVGAAEPRARVRTRVRTICEENLARR